VGFAEEWRECGGYYREGIEWERTGGGEFLLSSII
jgi:hypothetical protein